MDQDRNLTANFIILQALSTNGTGGSVTETNGYDYGSLASISALPDTGYRFAQWTGDGATDANASTTTVTMDQDRNLTPKFVILQKRFPCKRGKEDRLPDRYAVMEPGLHFRPTDTGYRFAQWTGDGAADANASTTTVTMDQDRNLTANFSLLQPILTLTSSQADQYQAEVPTRMVRWSRS